MLGEDFAEHRAKIRTEREVAALIELMVVQAGPLAVDLPAAHVAAHHEHAIRVAVVGAPVAVLARGAAEFAHGDENDVLHAVGQVLMKRRETLAEIAQQIRELPLHAAFVDVIVPAAAIHKQNLHADVGFQKLAYLLQALPEAARRILRAVFRLIFRGVGFAQKVDRLKRFRARALQRFVHGLRVHGFEPAFNHGAGSGRLGHHFELLKVRQRNRGSGALQRARKIRSHGHRPKRRSIFFGNRFERAVQPAIFGGFQSRCAGFHEVLRVKMRARGIGRARGVHDGKLIFVKERLERREAGMQAKKSVEVDGRIRASALRLRNRNGRAHAVIV